MAYKLVIGRINASLVSNDTVTVILLRIICCSALPTIPLFWFTFGFSRTNQWLHDHRWRVGAAIIVAATLLNINGSSLGFWSNMFGTPQNGLVLGEPRFIRTDEFTINTPFAFAQEYNDYQPFNTLINNHATDMNLIKDAPVWSITEVFRPFHWAYFLMGSSHGLAFYWCARLVLLFLATYELVLLITSDNRRIAVISATLISLSPSVQWWFAVNNLPEMLIAVLLAPALVHRYFNDTRTLLRVGYSLIIFQLAGMFILSCYPAWEIPLFLILCCLLVEVFVNNRTKIRLSRWDAFNLTWVTLLFAFVLIAAIYRSLPTIQAAMQTVYPGHRLSNGGKLSIGKLFTGFAGVVFPFKAYVGVENVTEAATIIDFFPIGVILGVVQLFLKKRKDVLSILLLIFIAISFIYMVFGLPTWLSRITFLSYTTSSRLIVVFQFANVLLLARCLSQMNNTRIRHPMAGLIATAIAYGLIIGIANHKYDSAYVGLIVALCIAAVAAVSFISLFALGSGSRLVVNAAAALTVFGLSISGLAVNPIQYAAAPLTNQPIGNQSRALQAVAPGLWATESVPRLSQFLVANGIPTLNALQIVPAMNIWKKLDPQGSWRSAYNRGGAWIDITIVAQEVSQPVKSVGPQFIAMTVTPKQLNSLGVKYVASSHQLNARKFTGYRFVPAGPAATGITVFRLVKTM